MFNKLSIEMFSVSTTSMYVSFNAFLAMKIHCSIKSNMDFLNIVRLNQVKFLHILASREQSGSDEK